MVIAVALLYRYADFVRLLGGTEFHLGWIVGVGMIGSLLMRLALGSCIDNYGTKMVWLGSTLLFAATCFAHLAVASHTGVAIYVLRILFCCALAGIAGASMTFVSKRGPTERMAELVGMLGTSGFLGIVVGTLLGDFLLGSVTVDRSQVELMFIAAGVLGLLSFPFAWLATRAEVRPKPSAGSSLLGVLRRHHPGAVLVVGVAMGLGLGLPGVFLRTYAAELDIPRIGLFFLVYAAAAIVTRVVTRRWPERFGTRPIDRVGGGRPGGRHGAVPAGPSRVAPGAAGGWFRLLPCDLVPGGDGGRQRHVSGPASRPGDRAGAGRLRLGSTGRRPDRRGRAAVQPARRAAPLSDHVSDDGRPAGPGWRLVRSGRPYKVVGTLRVRTRHGPSSP